MRIEIHMCTDRTSVRTGGRGRTDYSMECMIRDKVVKRVHEVCFEEHELNGACLEGLLSALRNLKHGAFSVKVCTPSQYLVCQINAGNFYRWYENGYQGSRGQPIRHAELWKSITDEIRRTCWKNITAEYESNSEAEKHMEVC